MKECVEEGILQSYFDGELSRKMAEGVAGHLASCVSCAEAASELENESLLLSEALRTELALSVPTERLRQRIDTAIAGLGVVESRQASWASKAGETPAVPVVRGWAKSIGELFTLAPQRAFAYAGLVAVILFATVVGGIYWSYDRSERSGEIVAVDILSIAAPPIPNNVIGTDVKATVDDKATVSNPSRQPRKTKLMPGLPGRDQAIANHVRLLPGERSYLKTIASLDATIKAESHRQMKPSLQVEYERNLAMVDQAIAATRSAAKVNPSDQDAADFMFAAYQSKIDLLSQVADARLSNRQR